MGQCLGLETAMKLESIKGEAVTCEPTLDAAEKDPFMELSNYLAECPICMESTHANKMVILHGKMHWICCDCVPNWVSFRHEEDDGLNCPLCREEVDEAQVHNRFDRAQQVDNRASRGQLALRERLWDAYRRTPRASVDLPTWVTTSQPQLERELAFPVVATPRLSSHARLPIIQEPPTVQTGWSPSAHQLDNVMESVLHYRVRSADALDQFLYHTEASLAQAEDVSFRMIVIDDIIPCYQASTPKAMHRARARSRAQARKLPDLCMTGCA